MRNSLSHSCITLGSDTIQSIAYDVIKYQGRTFTRRVFATEYQKDTESTVRWTRLEKDVDGYFPVNILEAVVLNESVNDYNPFTDLGYLPPFIEPSVMARLKLMYDRLASYQKWSEKFNSGDERAFNAQKKAILKILPKGFVFQSNEFAYHHKALGMYFYIDLA